MTSSRRSHAPHGTGLWNGPLGLLDQYLAPQQLLTRAMHRLTRVRAPWFKDRQIRWFIRRYQVDMSLAAQPDPAAYPDFNSFFTRALHPGARPVAAETNAVACPVDGAVSQLGDVEHDRLLQAKGRYYPLAALLGGSPGRAAEFLRSRYITLYLSPRDYHRVHMPLAGRLREMMYVPGRLFSVSPRTTRGIPALFARNERLITVFDTAIGPMAIILVGAMLVAGMETVWSGLIPHASQPREWRYDQGGETEVHLERGAELGRFNMGSTVILLFPPDRIELAAALAPGAPVKVGERLATILEREEQVASSK
jgi:phosphatidylserine decarboxylase